MSERSSVVQAAGKRRQHKRRSARNACLPTTLRTGRGQSRPRIDQQGSLCVTPRPNPPTEHEHLPLGAGVSRIKGTHSYGTVNTSFSAHAAGLPRASVLQGLTQCRSSAANCSAQFGREPQASTASKHSGCCSGRVKSSINDGCKNRNACFHD